ncbi:MAG: hypothetical protein HC849_04830 [Oscillatoriales cyanobacterium RU_3_3]|nr:hypothetical protein [Microcoleus sp. SU_5_6]NJL67034.1 hypothetical protein [Microcoleus sp. SM1_3_4]NJM59664.1 hypothetical protein [Oscillatoriales cyanobacterium RU_3_3]NJR23855.1 hypothetical protein [Richelia sp. CSU_2_1]
MKSSVTIEITVLIPDYRHDIHQPQNRLHLQKIFGSSDSKNILISLF